MGMIVSLLSRAIFNSVVQSVEFNDFSVETKRSNWQRGTVFCIQASIFPDRQRCPRRPTPERRRPLGRACGPVANDAAADYAIGQANLTSITVGTSASAVTGPKQAMIYNGKLLLTELQKICGKKNKEKKSWKYVLKKLMPMRLLMLFSN